MTIQTITANFGPHGEFKCVPLRAYSSINTYIVFVYTTQGFGTVDMTDHEGTLYPNYDEALEAVHRLYARDTTLDQNGHDSFYHYWLKHCHDDIGSDGHRITCARALQIIHELVHMYIVDGDLEESMTPMRDVEIASSVLAAIRAQRGLTDPNAQPDGYLTHYMDVVIYG